MSRRGRWASTLVVLVTMGSVGCAVTRLPAECSTRRDAGLAPTPPAPDESRAERPATEDALRLVVIPLLDDGSHRGRAGRASEQRALLDVARQRLQTRSPARTIALFMPADVDGLDDLRDRTAIEHPTASPDASVVPALFSEHTNEGGISVWVEPGPTSAQLQRIDVASDTDSTRVALTLLVVGAGYWDVHGRLGRGPRSSGAPLDLAELEAEVSRLRSDLAVSPRPVVLVSHMPVEATGIHGMGGLVGDATFRHAPAPLRDAILDGLFVGTIGGHEAEVAVQVDVSDGIRRSAKLDVADRVFLVQAGAALDRTRHDPRRVLARNRGIILDPEIELRAPAIVTLELHATSWAATVDGRRSGRWTTSCVRAPLHDAQRFGGAGGLSPGRWPSNAPCPTCDPKLTPVRPQ